jgi:hypothetical protein
MKAWNLSDERRLKDIKEQGFLSVMTFPKKNSGA